MEDAIFIEDGIERPFVIERSPGIHGELTGRRRLMTTKEVVAYRRKTGDLKDSRQQAAAERVRESMLAERVTHWSVPRPITAESIAKLHPVILSKLEAIVMGVIPDGTENLDEPVKSDAELVEELSGN